MNKEIKKENKKTSGIYWGIAAIVAILALFVIFKSKNTVYTTETAEVVTTEVIEPQEEKTVARIDITTTLIDADKPQFEVYVDNAETPIKEEGWMPKYNKQGVAVVKDGNVADIIIKPHNDIKITLAFRGPDKRNKNNEVIENWVDYNAISINGENILPHNVYTWLNKPFYHVINAKAGEEYKIHAEWTKADTVPEK